MLSDLILECLLQGLKIPALFGTFLPDWLGFASELGFEGLPGYLDADAASMTLQSMQITYNTCSSAWTETAILLNTPAGVCCQLLSAPISRWL